MYINNALEQLLHAYACANMHRASGNAEYANTALGWFDGIERQVKAARQALEKTVQDAKT